MTPAPYKAEASAGAADDQTAYDDLVKAERQKFKKGQGFWQDGLERQSLLLQRAKHLKSQERQSFLEPL